MIFYMYQRYNLSLITVNNNNLDFIIQCKGMLIKCKTMLAVCCNTTDEVQCNATQQNKMKCSTCKYTLLVK